MPPETITAGGPQLFDYLPPEVAGYAALALFILWVARKMYGELLADTRSRLAQVERSLSAVSQEHQAKTEQLAAAQAELAKIRERLDAAQKSESRCEARMERLERRYEARIAELEHEIETLRHRLGEISEPMI